MRRYAIDADEKVKVTAQHANQVRAMLAMAASTPEMRHWLNCAFVVKLVDVKTAPAKAYHRLLRESPRCVSCRRKSHVFPYPRIS